MASPARVPYATAARTLLRDTILGAVDDLARTRGWDATTMADVAKASGVSRQTLYNEFGSRPSLVEAYVAREIETMISHVESAVRTNADDPHRALREAFALFLKLASDEPVVQVIVADAEDGELHRLLTGLGQSIAADQVTALVADVWPQVTPADARLLSDTLVRLAISHALVRDPSGDHDAQVARVAEDVGRIMASFVDEILGRD